MIMDLIHLNYEKNTSTTVINKKKRVFSLFQKNFLIKKLILSLDFTSQADLFLNSFMKISDGYVVKTLVV